jgi:hypothetical protein
MKLRPLLRNLYQHRNIPDDETDAEDHKILNFGVETVKLIRTVSLAVTHLVFGRR